MLCNYLFMSTVLVLLSCSKFVGLLLKIFNKYFQSKISWVEKFKQYTQYSQHFWCYWDLLAKRLKLISVFNQYYSSQDSNPNGFRWELEKSRYWYSLTAVNCDFPGDNVIGSKSVWSESGCVQFCEDNDDCTAYLLIGNQTYWCVIKSGSLELKNASKFDGTSKCALITGLLNNVTKWH